MGLEDKEIQKMKDNFINLLKGTNREGMDKLITFIEKTDFFTAPSSTRFHGAYKGGLVRHTKAATRIAYELFRTEMYPYNQDQQDLILASLILHDSRKHGNNGSRFTVVEHPILAAEAIRKSQGVINPEWREIIAKNIETHMRKMDNRL